MPPTDEDPVAILIVDGNERNAELLSAFLRAEGYEPTVRTKSGPADDVVADPSRFAFAWIDIDRFDDSVWEYCRRLEEHDVPFIVLSGVRNPTLRKESHERGATTFVDKPVPKRRVSNLVETAIGT